MIGERASQVPSEATSVAYKYVLEPPPHPNLHSFTLALYLPHIMGTVEASTSSFAGLIEDQEILEVPSFTLESGVELQKVPVAYKTWGKLNENKDNVMIICHAFTGSADVEDWWVLHLSNLPVINRSVGGVH